MSISKKPNLTSTQLFCVYVWHLVRRSGHQQHFYISIQLHILTLSCFFMILNSYKSKERIKIIWTGLSPSLYFFYQWLFQHKIQCSPSHSLWSTALCFGEREEGATRWRLCSRGCGGNTFFLSFFYEYMKCNHFT